MTDGKKALGGTSAKEREKPVEIYLCDSRVEVTLTKAGEYALNEFQKKYFPAGYADISLRKTDSGEIVARMDFCRFMLIFGREMYTGAPVTIKENKIRVFLPKE